MPKVRVTASLAPPTITHISQGRVKRQRKTTVKSAHPVVINEWNVTVDQEVWETAKKLLKGKSIQHIEVRDETCVVIHNSPQWRQLK